ncbi:helix-turn-helix domain-containing protein [Rhodocytophaga aerolata]|uniref:Helix-turn-helix domain-containing protein n=1 Tax=Rhodocytophaga aerolata TaxID=455078 RepID=A0ABT8RI30_9BACT|nr:helix-turn-helix domain-containing protein [Rhodocytophaga aerolata]MDO1451624.1 helix-turn-helix domain-containing protein [Rhodocytophaga aerolata]
MRKTIATVQLSSVEQAKLKALVSKGKHSVRKVKRGRILLESFAGKKPEVIAQEVGVSLATVYNIHKRYEQQGLQAALAEKPRSGQPRKVTPAVEAAVTQIACSAAPEGRSRWTIRLINERLVSLGYELEDESVRLILKKVSSNPGSKSNGVSER